MRSYISFTIFIVSWSIGLVLLGGAITPAVAHVAQTGSSTTSPRDLREQRRVEVQQMREAQKVDFDKRREELQKQIQEQRDTVKESFQAAREAKREQVEQKREEFRAKLQEVKDERKKEHALRVNEQLDKLNERWTTHFMIVLDRLSDILGKVQLRMEKARANAANIDRVKTAMGSAETAVSTARQAVEEQAKKSYSVTFTSEDTLKQAMRNARQLLHRDLTALRDGAIRDARQAVQNAIQALRDVPRVDEEPQVSTPPASALPTSTPPASGTSTSTSQ